MSDRMVFKVEGVGKKFCRSHRHSMFYGTCDVLRGMLGRPSHAQALRPQEFWALEGITFGLRAGERLGLLGANGSGKSTLLRLLAGIYQPDAGRIEVRGKICALIALGAGFHPLLTGRDNVYLNGAILGMSKRAIDRCFEQIVEFAGVGEFLDAPVKTYSSGMYVRLAFAIAVHSNPKVLVVDEILAVGDAAFQKKCFEQVAALNEQGTALVFVSHSMSAVERLCTSALVLSRGRQAFQGKVREAVQFYSGTVGNGIVQNGAVPEPIGLGEVTFSNVCVYEDGGTVTDPNIEFGRDFVIQFDYKFLRVQTHDTQVRVWVRTIDGRDVQRLAFQECAFEDQSSYANVKILPLREAGTVKIKVLRPCLFPQTFRVDVAMAPVDRGVHLGGLNNAALFNIVHPRNPGMYFEYGNHTITEFEYSVTLS